MVSACYQMRIVDGLFFQTTLTDVPNPGVKSSIPNALTINFRTIAIF